jgi:ubiquinone/menaquinone biosynthesis C-methylase UbiE
MATDSVSGESRATRAIDEQKYVKSQYSSQHNLAVRIRTHQLYSEHDVDFASWVLDAINWRGDELVLDVGCGAGVYTGAARERARYYVAGDLSLGMLRELPQTDASYATVSRVNLDAQTLPVRHDGVHVILANHMLYHVPDIDQALSQFRRVLKRGGYLLAATNSEQTMRELEGLQQDVMKGLDIRAPEERRTRLSFTMESGEAFLRRHFAHIEQRLLPNALVFPEAQPVLDYLESSFEWYESGLPAGTGWVDVSGVLRQAIEERLAQHGAFRVSKLSGVFVAWND